MTVPFEGGEIPHLTPEQQQAADFAAFYVAEVEDISIGREKPVWGPVQSDGSRVAELVTYVLNDKSAHPFSLEPVTITDYGQGASRTMLKINLPEGLKAEGGSWSEAGALRVDRDGSFTLTKFNPESLTTEERALSPDDIEALKNRLNRSSLYPYHKPLINESPVSGMGVFQWERPQYLENSGDKRSLLDAILAGMKHREDGRGDYIMYPPVNSARGYTGSFGSDHTPVDTVFGLFTDGETPVLDTTSLDKFKITNESRILHKDPNLLANRSRQHWSDDPGIPVWQVASGDAVNVYISDGMFHITKKPVAEPDAQTPEDK